jgi:hypothetical protein
MGYVDIFQGHLEYFTDIWVILCAFGTFWYHVPRKIWQPWIGAIRFGRKFIRR